MNRRNKKFLFVLVLLIFSIITSVILVVSAQQEKEFKTLRVGVDRAPITMDPANHRHRVTQNIIRCITRGLYQTMPDGQHMPDLAESITLLDPVTYEIKLRQGVTFHNGDPMTADDVIFSIQRIGMPGGMEGADSPRISLFGPIKSLEKKDDFTIILTLERPNQIVQLRNWYHYEVIPKKYFEEVGLEGFMKHPIGIGPFKWVEGDLNSQIVLEKYENYYGKNSDPLGELEQIPVVDRLIFLPIPEPTTRVAALISGEVDIVETVPYDMIQLLQDNPDVKVESGPGTTCVLMHLNTSKPPFSDKRVRQAISYAIDYDLITKHLLLGHSDPLYGLPFMEPFEGEPGTGAFNDIQGREYNLEKAKALIEEAGVKGFSAVIDTYSPYEEEAQVIAQMLTDIGINASVRMWEQGVLLEEFKKGERDIFYQALGNGRKAPQWSFDVVGTKKPHNYSQYSNPVFDDLMQKALAIPEDSQERNNFFKEAFGIIMEDWPIVNIHAPRIVNAIRADVTNYVVSGGALSYMRAGFK